MSATPPTSGPLDAECMAFLEGIEHYVTPLGPGYVEVRNCDGDFRFRVTTAIKVFDLTTMVNLFHHRFGAGQDSGREQAFASLRALLGVDDAIAKATGSTS